MTIHKKKIFSSNPLLFLFLLCIVITIFLTCSVNAKAEGLSYILPYNPYSYQDLNTLFWDDTSLSQSIINGVYDLNQTNPNINCDLDNFFMFVEGIYNYSGYKRLQIRVVSGCVVNTSITADFNFSVNQIQFQQVTNGGSVNATVDVYPDGSWNNLQVVGYHNAGQRFNTFGSIGTSTFGDKTVTLRYPFYCSPVISDQNDNVIMVMDLGDPVPEYENLEQFLDITSTISNGIDDALSDLQNQQGFFTNLISNLKNFFNSLKGWLYAGFNNLSLNIKNFFGPFLTNFLNKINEFFESFEDFKDKFSKLFQIIASIYNLGLKNGEFDLPTLVVGLIVPDVDQLSGIIRSSVLGAIVFSLSTFSANTISFVQSWFNTTPVYIYHIPDFTFHGQTISGLYFDFSWYSSYKPYGDAIISFWLVINYGMFLLRFVPRFLRSAGSGYSEGSDIVDYYDHSDRDDGSYYFENGMRAPSMFDFM